MLAGDMWKTRRGYGTYVWMFPEIQVLLMLSRAGNERFINGPPSWLMMVISGLGPMVWSFGIDSEERLGAFKMIPFLTETRSGIETEVKFVRVWVSGLMCISP